MSWVKEKLAAYQAELRKAEAVMRERDERMRQMRRDGHTLQEIGDVFGVTRERVRQVTKGERPTKPCQWCGAPTPTASAVATRTTCDACWDTPCAKCGKPFRNRSHDVRPDGHYHWHCSPDRKGARAGGSYKQIEQGVYRRIYPGGALVNDNYYAQKRIDGKQKWLPFPTIEEARAWRAANVRPRRANRSERTPLHNDRARV